MKKNLFIFLLLAILALLSGCRVGPEALAEPVTIQIMATKDFGHEFIFKREAVVETRMSAQDVLATVAELETDGSYIIELEGLRGNDQLYWMYYVNGLLSKYFAGGYTIRPGDVMHWDFHPWAGAYHGSSAIIGAFPEPLLHGYEGQTRSTTVVYGEGCQDEAALILEKLQELGVTDISLSSEESLAESVKSTNNLVIIADSSCSMIEELNNKSIPLGMYGHFGDSYLWLTDYRFEVKEKYGAGTGVIQACQNLWDTLGTGACRSAVFMVSGVDTAGVERAVRVLLENMDAIEKGETPAIAGAYGIIITENEELTRMPR